MSLAVTSTAMNSFSTAPGGCPSAIDPRYYTLCDLKAVWGIVVEAFASAGILASFLLLLVMVSSLPFVIDRRRKSVLALQVTFLIFSLGLFGLSFAFIMGRDSTTCTARRFVFGVLFAGCFACLLMHSLWLALLDRHKKCPQGRLFWLGALGLWLVEVIINTEWMIITQMPQDNAAVIRGVCDITNKDFTMALIYVMVLLVAVVLMAVLSMTHTHKSFRQDALYILLTGLLSFSIWLVWIVMYIHGNKILQHSNWDDATLAIALVSNGWVFLLIYTIPEVCALTKDIEDVEVSLEGQHCLSSIRVYENFLRDQTDSQFDTAKKLISPYSGYNGQVRSRVYQATELAIISKGPINEISHEEVLPSATAPPLVPGSSSPLPSDNLCLQQFRSKLRKSALDGHRIRCNTWFCEALPGREGSDCSAAEQIYSGTHAQ
ncbi:G-protein coupled receptor family C group 5 member C-like [Colossoma macropomum]|uniref:G-protein coupled receptor family C group 5 member C-like n=1 Tax=Colossoma macropomum TaxID=42526 RepID=UPI00186488D9|nr:G-protein coupled receptor family C group 5 member C-like [Colossoma macropomum]